VAAVNLESMLFVFVLPGTVAGGVVRWYRFSSDPGTGARVAACIVVEFLVEIASLLCLACAAAFVLGGGGAPQGVLTALSAAAGLGLAAIVGTFLLARPIGRLLERLHGGASARFGDRAGRVVRTLGEVVTGVDVVRRAHGWPLLLGTTVVSTITGYVGGWMVARSIVPGLPMIPYVVGEATLGLAAQVPVTFAGAGVYETLAPPLMSGIGVGASEAILIAVSYYARIVGFAVGGLFARRRLARAPGA
jgi:hypothetical protein